jgi:hypothetical protein
MVLPDLPDLTITGVSVPTPSGVGQPIQVSWTVANIGTQPAYGFWTDEIYLSTDNIFSTNDIWIGSYTGGNGASLDPGTSLTRREIILLPSVPSAGIYTLFFRTNPFADVQESRTDNNLFSLPVTINLNGPDLAIVAAAAPLSARFGDTITVSWTVRNDGTAPASASWIDDVYLSDDDIFDARDRALGFSVVTNSLPLAVGQSYTRTLSAVLPRALVRQGTYHLIVRSDPGQAQGEISEANNIFARSISLTDPNAVLPVVTLATTPAGGSLEDSGTPLAFNFLRSGSTANPLSVRVGISGLAVAGSDYTIAGAPAGPLTSAVVTFAAGSSTSTLLVNPLMDANPEGDENVTLTLQAGQGYLVGTTTGVTNWILNDDQVVEAVGNAHLFRRSDDQAFVRSGGVTWMVSSPSGAKVGGPTSDWMMLAAETINGVNQILWRYKPTSQVQLWTLNADWSWKSSSPLIDRTSPQAWDFETGFQLDLNNDTIIGVPFSTVESVGNTTLLRRGDDRAFVQRADGTRQIVSSPSVTAVGNPTSAWQMLAAETVAGTNQLLLRQGPTDQFQVWNLDASWTWQSSSALIPRTSPQIWDFETDFQLDLNNDTLIGGPLTAVESLGNATLLRRPDGRAFVQSVGGVPMRVSSPWGADVGLNTSEWKMLAAETVGGVNQILWRHRPSRQLQVWSLDSNWDWQSSSRMISRTEPMAWDLETAFQLDLTNDTIIGAPFSTIETQGNTTLLQRGDGWAFVQPASGTRQMVTSPWGAWVGNSTSVFQMLAAETIAGSNTVLWLHRPSNQLHLWALDSSWNWTSSSPLIDRSSPQAWEIETGFQMDLNNDAIIGAPFSTIESQGNTSLLRRGDGWAFVQPAGGTRQMVRSPWGADTGNPTSTFQMLGAETIAGSNSILWLHRPSNQLHLWALDSSWNWTSSSPLIDRFSPQAWAIETGFQMDLNNDGRIGQPL